MNKGTLSAEKSAYLVTRFSRAHRMRNGEPFGLVNQALLLEFLRWLQEDMGAKLKIERKEFPPSCLKPKGTHMGTIEEAFATLCGLGTKYTLEARKFPDEERRAIIRRCEYLAAELA